MMDKRTLQNDILEKTYQPDRWLEVMKEYFGAKKFHQKPQAVTLPNNEIAQTAVELGSFYTTDERLVGIYEVKLTNNAMVERNRVGLRNLFKSVIRYDLDAALIVYIQNHKWRFSYVSEIRTEEGKKETEPKRYTYIFGEGESCRTAADRFDKLKGKQIYLNDLFEAFSVEKLNKEFFKTYKEFYEKFWKYLAASKNYNKLLSDTWFKDDDVKREKPIRDFAKKLLGRIVFLQFLQKKGWMGVPVKYHDWKGGDVKFLQSLFNNCKSKATFHSKELKTLFFETLNTKRNNHLAPASLGKSIKIPYLNGGLFERDLSFTNDIDFPEDFFAKLLDFFEQYNFTIDENDPYDSEVGIDPEMLGHIFENLLEENREKGAFYTPKEIVHYMCQESLIEYLHTQLPNLSKEDVGLLVRNNQVSQTFAQYKTANTINEKLKAVRICDPAIGSGAFPMGLLKEIFECRRLLYGYLKTNEKFDPAQVKKEIIQNNIYGVDIENGAVDIARLRFWLALVVDELEPQPLPNLDYKIMQGNSLLERFEGVDLSHVANNNLKIAEPAKDLFGNIIDRQLKITYTKTEIVAEIQNRMRKFFNLEDAKLKEKYRREIDELVHRHIEFNFDLRKSQIERFIEDLGKNLNDKQKKKLAEYQKQLATLETSYEKLKELENRNDNPFFLWKLFFADVFEGGGFDIVIGNPPYIQLQKEAGALARLLESCNYKTFERTGDIYSLFYEKGTELLKPKGHLCFITSNKWMRAGYGESTRQFFAENTNPILLIDFAGQKIFDSATVDTNILLLSKEKNQQKTLSTIVKEKVLNNLSVFVRQAGTECAFLGKESWTILSPIEQSIKRKVEAVGTPLKDWNISIYRGILTGYNEAFIIDGKTKDKLIVEDSKSGEIIRPILRGRDIKRYGYDFADLWLINTHNGIKEEGIKPININDYPAVRKHLDRYWKDIEKRTDQGITPYNLRNCAYMDDFSKQKILWAETMRIRKENTERFPRFSYTTKPFYTDKTCFIAVGKDLKYVLAFLNSTVGRYQFSQTVSMMDNGGYLMQKIYVEQIKISTLEEKLKIRLVKLVDSLLEIADEKILEGLENQIDTIVFNSFGIESHEQKYLKEMLAEPLERG